MLKHGKMVWAEKSCATCGNGSLVLTRIRTKQQMSRIGKKPVPIAKGVDVQIEGRQVTVKGPLGQLGWGLADGVGI